MVQYKILVILKPTRVVLVWHQLNYVQFKATKSIYPYLNMLSSIQDDIILEKKLFFSHVFWHSGPFLVLKPPKCQAKSA